MTETQSTQPVIITREHPKPDLTSWWAATLLHDAKCAGCMAEAESGITMAIVTGSTGSTHQVGNGVTIDHSATVKRTERPTPDVTGAYLEPHTYDSFPEPVPFWIVRCNHESHGPIALNAGHHYREHTKHHAELLIVRHNAEEHAPEPRACCHPRSCSSCGREGIACGRHHVGDSGHERCTGQATNTYGTN